MYTSISRLIEAYFSTVLRTYFSLLRSILMKFSVKLLPFQNVLVIKIFIRFGFVSRLWYWYLKSLI